MLTRRREIGLLRRRRTAAPGKALARVATFCIASANVVITKELCPYYEHTATAYAYRRFDGKSRVSVYLSHVHQKPVQELAR